MKSVYLIMKKLMRSKFVLPGKLEAYAVCLLLIAGLSIRTAFPDLGYFSIHTERDLYRTQQLIRGVEFPLVGSELSYGGRTFGPAMYLLRYYVVSYPAPFITSAIGIVVLFRAANRWRSSLPWARILVTFCWLLVFVQLVFAVMYLSLLRHSGRMLPYGDNYAPTLAMMLNARELLLREARIDRDAWFNRVHSDGFGTLGWGECSLDWLITQDERSLQSPSPDPHLRWVFTGSRTPAPQGKAIRRWALLPGDLCLLEYRVDDRETTIPDNTSMRNPYFAMRPMRYLGPDESLRKATPPPPFRPGEMEL